MKSRPLRWTSRVITPKGRQHARFRLETVEIEPELMLPEPLLVRRKDVVLTKSLGRVLLEGERLMIVYCLLSIVYCLLSIGVPSSFLWISDAP